jgi:hypothetical protein
MAHTPTNLASELDLGALASSAQAKAVKVPSEALTPSVQAYVNENLSAAIREIFKEFAPIMASLALTPEKIAMMESERRKPTESQEAYNRRQVREKKMMREEQEINRKTLEATQAACPHAYPSGLSSINIIRNYPDRHARGICVICQLLITPRQWVIDAPNDEFPHGVERIAPEHPQYGLVRRKLAEVGGV